MGLPGHGIGPLALGKTGDGIVRDLILIGLFGLSMLGTLRWPWLGILVWACFDYMNPHRLCYGIAKDGIPFSMITAVVTLGSMVISRESKRIAWTMETTVLALFVVWVTVTTTFALNPQDAWPLWDRAVKIQVLMFATLIAMRTPKRLNLLLWTIAISIGFYGVKGAAFAVVTGGGERVRGPEQSFIEDNNDIALALATILPLLRYLQMRTERRWVRWGLGIAMVATTVSVLASYSRAGLLALGAAVVLMLLKSRRKVVFGLLLATCLVVVLNYMPQQWYDRMNSIGDYQEDASAQGRLNAWGFAINLTKDHPITGGGFGTFTPELFLRYAPDPYDHHEAHNIFLKIMAEHGVPGVALFLLMGGLTWISASRIRRTAHLAPGMEWMADLSSMIQSSLVVYAVGGSFSNLAYFGLPYHLMVMVILMKPMLRDAIYEAEIASEQPAAIPEEVLSAS